VRPEDDYPHPIGAEPNFNESMYLHLHDPGSGLGGFVRLANRPNEGRGERTVCLYLPDGRLGFSYARPEVTTNDAFDAAGLRITVREPLRHLDVAFDGPVSVLADPAAMDDPKRAFEGSPSAPASVRLAVRGLGPAFDHSFDAEGESFAPNHYEQLIAVEGTVRVGELDLPVRGYGLRDHSWGPRYWQTPWFYRWLHGCGDGVGFMGAHFGRPDGPTILGGFVWDGGEMHEVTELAIRTERDGRDEQSAITAELAGPTGRWTVHGEVRSAVPLRHRRDGQVTRIVEGLTRWTLGDGRALYGMSEYLDQIVADRPVGLAV
jgi:hypothetical protein